jgi:hypothetical protein
MGKVTTSVIFFAVAQFAGSALIAIAAPLPPTGTFVYSNACSSPGGDFAGYRVTLIHSLTGTRATIEFNDDGLDGRDMARNLKFNPVSGALSFSFRGSVDGDQYSFHGTASPEKLVGVFDVKLTGETGANLEPPLTMPLVKKVPRYLPPCDLRISP